jgi:beta-glucanase (GH16 family)
MRHKPGIGLLIATGLALFGISAAHAVPSGYSLVWSDEFNGAVGSAPNSANWSYDTGAGGWGNGEWETYVTDTAHVGIVSDSGATDGKALRIEATYNAAANSYQSGRIKTQGKKAFTYGYIEARARTTTGIGKWPAFWMLGSDFNGSNWPQCGEMDIMEYIGNATEQASYHMGTWSNRIDWSASYGTNNPNAYHTYGLLWTSTGVTNYVDGVQFETHPSSSPGWIFNKPFFFLLNFAVGGGPPGNPWANGTPVFPWDYFVDYVRVYQPGGGTTGSTTGGTTGSTTGSLSGIHSLTPQCATGSRLDDNNFGTANGNKIQIWSANGSTAQQWNLSTSGVSPTGNYNLAINLGPYCLNAGGTTSGSVANLWGCNGSSAQSWNVTPDSQPAGYYQLKPANNGTLCLDVNGAGTADGTQVLVYTCNSTNAQQWLIQ